MTVKSTASTLISAILLKPYQVSVGPKALGHSTRFWIGGNFTSAISVAITRSTTPCSWAETGVSGLEPGEGQ